MFPTAFSFAIQTHRNLSTLCWVVSNMLRNWSVHLLLVDELNVYPWNWPPLDWTVTEMRSIAAVEIHRSCIRNVEKVPWLFNQVGNYRSSSSSSEFTTKLGNTIVISLKFHVVRVRKRVKLGNLWQCWVRRQIKYYQAWRCTLNIVAIFFPYSIIQVDLEIINELPVK